MTKEELEKEAEQYAIENWEHYEEGQTDYKALKQAYLDSAEPREKEIKSLGERCLQLQKDKGNLTDKVNELKSQIEKMKCCENCLYRGFGRNFEGRCNIQGHIIKNPFEEKCDKWEIEEK